MLAKLVQVDGAASGLDADLLDGLSSSAFIRADTPNTNVSTSSLTLGPGGVIDWGACPANPLPTGFSLASPSVNDGFCLFSGSSSIDQATLFITTQDNGNADESVYIGSGVTCCAPDWLGLLVRGDGNALLSGSLSTGQGQLFADVAENVPADADIEPGDVVVAAEDARADYGLRFVRTQKGYDTAVVGVISDTQALAMGPSAGRKPVALAGLVLVKADASHGAIAQGDLLVSSPTPGHAMKAKDMIPGSVIGKALKPLAEGRGRVMMLVMPR